MSAELELFEDDLTVEERLEHLESFLPFIIQLQQALASMALNPMFAAFLTPQQRSFLGNMTKD